MADVLFILALLVGVISVINKAMKKVQQKAGNGPAVERIHPSAGSRQAPERRYGERKRPAGRPPFIVKEDKKAIGAPLPPRYEHKGRCTHDSLGRIFQDKEQLLAAFIFHEVLSPPRSRRRN